MAHKRLGSASNAFAILGANLGTCLTPQMSHTPGSDIPNTGEIEREPLKVICQLETLTITYPIFFNCLILGATILSRDGPLLVGILITAVSSLNIVSYNGYIFHFIKV